MEEKRSKEAVYLLEDGDGFMVRVPASKLEAWKKQQSEPPAPLNAAERRVADKIMERIYGKRKEGDAP